MRRVQPRVDRRNVAPQLALQPSLRLHPVQRIALVASSLAPLKQPLHQLAQLARILLRQRGLIGPRAKRDLLHAVEALARVAHPHPRKLQPMQPKRHLHAALNPLLHHRAHRLRHQRHHPRRRLRKALPRRLVIRRVQQPRRQVALVRRVLLFQLLGLLVELPQLPLRSVRIHPGKPRCGQHRHAARHNQPQSPILTPRPAVAAGLAAVRQPQHAQRQDPVGRRLRLLRIHRDHRPRLVPMHQRAARIGGPKALLQVHCGAESVCLPLAPRVARAAAAQHHPLQRPQVVHPRRLARRGRSPVAVAPESPANRAASARIAVSSGAAFDRAPRRVPPPPSLAVQHCAPRSKVAACIARARWQASTSPPACRRGPSPPPSPPPSDAPPENTPAPPQSARRSAWVQRMGFQTLSCAAKSNKDCAAIHASGPFSFTSSPSSCAGA